MEPNLFDLEPMLRPTLALSDFSIALQTPKTNHLDSQIDGNLTEQNLYDLVSIIDTDY